MQKVKSTKGQVWILFLLSCSALSLFPFFLSVAASHENTVLYRCVDERRFFAATFEMCVDSSFRPTQRLIR
jgi:hypothetical protein